jgi:membrane protease YdiL (CAAX protease family)
MALVVNAPLFGLILAGAISERESALDAQVVAVILVVLLTTPLQAAGEEYLFRGVLLQALGAVRLPTIACCLLSGLLFATAHLQFEAPLFADRFLLGTVFAYLVVKTGGLEAPIAIHAIKNVAVFIPAALLEETEEALDPQNVTWIPFGVDVVLLAILVPWMLRRYRKPGAWHAGMVPPALWPPDQAPLRHVPSQHPAAWPPIGGPGSYPPPMPGSPLPPPVPPGAPTSYPPLPQPPYPALPPSDPPD